MRFQPLLTRLADHWPLALAGLGALLLVVAEFSTLYEVVAITAVVPGGSRTSGSNHFYALLLLALAALPMAWGAVRGGSRPAAVALAVIGAAALLIVLLKDLPVIGDEGLLAETYEAAKAGPRRGFWLELVGSLLVLGAGIGTLVFSPAGDPSPNGAPRRGRRPPAEPAAADPSA